VPLLLDLIYLAALAAIRLLGKLKPRWADTVAGRMRRRDVEYDPPGKSKGAVLVHAVSVGEVQLLRAFITDLESMFPGYEIIVSTSTPTGRDVAEKNFPMRKVVQWPLDLSFHVRPFLDVLRVRLVLLMELEVWPNFMLAAARKKVPVMVVNGRLTAESFRRYRLFRFFFKRVFRKLKRVFAQNEVYGERFARLGVPRGCIVNAGTMKYDLVPTGGDPERTAAVRSGIFLDSGEPVIVAGSTHPGEEADMIDAWLALKNDYPDLRLILAPRHIDRVGEVKDMAWDAGENFYLKSEFDREPDGEFPDKRVLIVDTVGDLAEIYRVATVAFVGGSLVQYGGHNMLEAASLGVPVVTGQYTDNFADTVELLLGADALLIVRSKSELRKVCGRLLGDASLRKSMGDRAIRAIDGAKGATRRHLEVLAEITGVEVPERLAARTDACPVAAAAASP
jgi:3-deoxy-D-manno-octulosonic-acid transferase